jgi:hypothetical protein
VNARPYISHPFLSAISLLFPLMPPDTFSPSLPIAPSQSWTQDSTLADVQQEQQSEGPDGVIVFEKKWIVTEDGDDSASYFLSSNCSTSAETRQAVSLAADTRSTSISHSLSNDAIAAFQFRDGLDKNGIFFDPNIDSSSETTAGAYRYPPPVTPGRRTHPYTHIICPTTSSNRMGR